MKVLTLKQPWATLVAECIKKYEFRSWKTNYRGKVLIHTGAGIDKKEMDKFKYLNLSYPSKKIIAVVEIEDCLELDDVLNKCTKDNKLDLVKSKKEFDDNLSENCILEGIINYTYSAYDKFLKQRRQLIAKYIKDYYESL